MAEKATEAKKELAKAHKQQGAWMVGAATIRLTKLCMPKCMAFDTMTVTSKEEACLESCIQSLHATHVKSL
jgi:hypothetical protein